MQKYTILRQRAVTTAVVLGSATLALAASAATGTAPGGQLGAALAAGAGVLVGFALRGRSARQTERFFGVAGGAIDQMMIGAAETSHFIDSIRQKVEQDLVVTQRIVGHAEQSTANTEHISANAERASAVAAGVLRASLEGRAEVDQSLRQIGDVRADAHAALALMTALQEKSRRINGITDAINEIAERTNLLALNAAIEAARAGPHGRGFAVVAGEVRQLALRTKESSGEIGVTVREISAQAERAAAGMAALSGKVVDASLVVERVHGSFRAIEQASAAADSEVQAIVLSSREQVASTRAIADAMEQIRDGMLDTQMELPRASQSAMSLSERAETLFYAATRCDAATSHDAVRDAAQDAAARIGKLFEAALASGRISEQALFDRTYTPIPNTNPPKYTTAFDAFTDRELPAIQEALLEAMPQLTYAGAVDDNGYFPTHNRKFCQRLSGDYDLDLAQNRTKRIFDDRIGARCGAHEQPYLLQTYKRDTGEVMHDMSVPIRVGGKHWGGFRIGYRSQAPLEAVTAPPAAQEAPPAPVDAAPRRPAVAGNARPRPALAR